MSPSQATARARSKGYKFDQQRGLRLYRDYRPVVATVAEYRGQRAAYVYSAEFRLKCGNEVKDTWGFTLMENPDNGLPFDGTETTTQLRKWFKDYVRDVERRLTDRDNPNFDQYECDNPTLEGPLNMERYERGKESSRFESRAERIQSDGGTFRRH